MTIILLTLLQTTITVNITSTLNEKCLCDISTDQCDLECCCDEKCSSEFITKWNTFNLCNDDSLSIPFCSQLTNKDGENAHISVLDMHSGLRTLYTVVKRLFCITSTNFVDVGQTWYDSTVSDEQASIAVNQMQKAGSTQSNKAMTGVKSFSISGLPLSTGSGICKSSTKLTSGTNLAGTCRVFIKNTGSINQTLLSTNSMIYNNIKKYTTKDVSQPSAAQSDSLTTSCNSNNCNNIIRSIHIYFNSEDNSVNTDSSYIVVGDMSIDQTPAYITISYEYVFVTTVKNADTAVADQLILPKQSNIGYVFGQSKVALLMANKLDTGIKYYKMPNPFNLAFRKSDGNCRTVAADDSANSFIQLVFGQNQIYTCVGESNMIYGNLQKVFNYVGRYATGTSSSSSLADYLVVPKLSANVNQAGAGNFGVQILIYYAGIGSSTNRQNQILKIELQEVSSKNGYSALYVEYVDIGNDYTLYVPPAPTVDAYLPNDFLYPFYVAE